MEKVTVRLNDDYCSRCSICRSLCPFEAITRDSKTGKIIIEIEKCQTCGICYSACPSKAIDTIYYDVNSLLNYLKKTLKQHPTKTLIIMCKGSAPDPSQVGKIFGVLDFIPLSVPCVGRLPDEVFLLAMGIGISKIYVLACDEDYCRFERGSPLAGRRILALNRMLGQLDYEGITLRRSSLKVKVDKDRCIACGNCVFVCPYHAPTLESENGISFDLDACRGCGLCVAMCPAFALELENWERERLSALISRLLSEMESPKIVVFRCQWSSFPSLDGSLSPNVRFVELPCAARVDVIHILDAFQNGADGVLIAACAEEDCKQEGAGGKAQHLVARLREKLTQFGYQDRLHFCSVAPRDPGRMVKELEEFSQKIREISGKKS